MDVLVESAVRATALAAAVMLVLRVLRVASPRMLHRAWAGVALTMLLLPALVAWGPEAAIPLRQPAPAFSVAEGEPGGAGAESISAVAFMSESSPSPRLDWRLAVAVVYAIGVLLLLVRLALGVRRARLLVREAELVNGRLTHRHCLTPLTAGLIAPVVILPRGWTDWSEAELAAVIAHEEEHRRRRDPLIALLIVLNRSVFWFHPLAWWLQRTVSALAEQACDEVVIRQGHDPQAYAASLVRFAKSVAAGGRRVALLGTGMPGADLPARLRVLARPPVPVPSIRRLACLTVAYAGAVAVSAAATPTPSPRYAGTGPVPAAGAQAAGSEWLADSSDHFEILYEKLQAGRIDEVKQRAEEAYAQVSGRLKYQLGERVLVILVRRNTDVPDGAARSSQLATTGALPRQHIVISTELLDTHAGALVHELTHSFAFEIIPRAAAAAPWLAEGLAEHQRGLWKASDYRQMREDVSAQRFPDLDSLTAADGRWGQALFDFAASRYTDEGIRRLLFTLRTRPLLAGAIPAAFDVPYAEFIDGFRAYLADRFGER